MSRLTQMARLYTEDGLSYEQIGERFGITRQRVGQLLGPLNLANHRLPQERARRMAELTAAHTRICAGDSDLTTEADRLGYLNGSSLRTALWRLGLRVTSPREVPEHGTLARYRRGCHCSECRDVNAAAGRSLIGREPPQHGTDSGYRNYRCRCVPCRKAYRQANTERRRRKEVRA